jgi:phosphoserine phosphatase RsbU/P
VEQKTYPIIVDQFQEQPILTLKELVARLHREQNKIQNLLSSLGFALRSFNNLNQFLELTPLMASRVADADGGALILLKNNGQIRLEQVHCQSGYACQTIREGIEKVTKEISIFKGDGSSFSLDEEIKKYLPPEVQVFSTPILIKNDERGRLYVFSSDPGYLWNQTRKKLVQLVADQTSVAIANHELTAELRKKERQDRELEIGSEIQSHLLPGKCPDIEGVELAAVCKTANRIGGDYYDFIPTNYDQLRKQGVNQNVPWSIVIGDVMGKGVPAGLIMTMTRGMLRAEILNRHSPAKILEHLNRVMYADLENSHRFVTLFYSEYDPVSKMLSFSNAAHNPPLLWRYQSNSIEKLDTWGMLVGLEADAEYEDATMQLCEGDTVLYYTDGLTDAVNQHGDRFDEDNLYNAFKWACLHFDQAQLILDYLIDSVNNFIGPDNVYTDDITLVVLKVKKVTNQG